MKSVINGFKPMGGKHCITSSLKQIFQYYDKHISEEMLFGIGSGLGFVYINLVNSPMISGRIKPFEFEEKISNRLNIQIKCRSTKIYEKACDRAKELISTNKPILIYADMPYLDYLNLGEDNHFGGHAIILFGFDDDKSIFYVSDRDNSNYPIRTPKGYISQDFHLVKYSQVEKARSSNNRPFPANNKWLEFNLENYEPITKATIFNAIGETCNSMLNSPANLLGINGIAKFSKEVLKWSKFDKEKIKLAGVTNYFMISSDGGTGGGIFREMYGEFLIQASEIVDSKKMQQLGVSYISISKRWDKVADLMWRLSENGSIELLQEMSDIIKEIHMRETTVVTELQELIILLDQEEKRDDRK